MDDSATTVVHYQFGADEDANRDQWPDGWRRLSGRRYPHYVKMRRVPLEGLNSAPVTRSVESPLEESCFRFELDGGNAVARSPELPLDPRFAYTLTARVRTSALRYNQAFIQLLLLDKQGRVQQSYASSKRGGHSDWTELQVGPILPSSGPTQLAIGLHLESEGRSDLHGFAEFDDVRLIRLPRMTLHAVDGSRFFSRPDEVTVSCRVSGIDLTGRQASFQLTNVLGELLSEQAVSFESELSGVNSDPDRLSGECRWHVPLQDFGYYRVRVRLSGGGASRMDREMALAVVRPDQTPSQHAFGWSLRRPPGDLPAEQIAAQTHQFGVSWLKLPVWFDEQETERATQTRWLVDQLGLQGVRTVGVLDRPPESLRRLFGLSSQTTSAEAFQHRDFWEPALAPVLSRLALRVRWWQIGADGDSSFIELPGLQAITRDLMEAIRKFDQGAMIGLAWRWLHQPPDLSHLSHKFLGFSEHSDLTAAELDESLQRAPAHSWVTLGVLPASRYAIEDRTQDLIQRLVTAKKHDAKAIFVDAPYAPETGLLEADGQPGEMFVPWYVTTQVLAGSQYLGSLQLPNGSSNLVFAKGDQAVMVVWNSTPVVESLYLGEEVHQMNAWGQARLLPNLPREQAVVQDVQVGSQPTFLTGVDLAIARWRLQFRFLDTHLVSLFGKSQSLRYEATNPFPIDVDGEIQFHLPRQWKSSNAFTPLRVSSLQSERNRLQTYLEVDATSGPQTIRIDFRIQADRAYRFSVYRNLTVGLTDMDVHYATRMDAKGTLLVDIELENRNEQPLDLECLLFAPQRKRQRYKLVKFRRGRRTMTFRIPDAEDLLNQTIQLRVEEVSGNRLLNFRVPVLP